MALDLFAFGGFVQFELRWPLRPQRKQIGEELLDEPAGLSDRAHWAFGAEEALPIDFALVVGRGLCWLPFLPLDPFDPFDPFLSLYVCLPVQTVVVIPIQLGPLPDRIPVISWPLLTHLGLLYM